MKRIATLLMLAFGLSAPAVAATYAVGTCLPKLPSFSTISDAVAGVPAGSTIDVCPGTYNETVTILQPLTLQGITSADSDLVVISGGSLLDFTGAVTVISAAPVNISNIQVQPPGGGAPFGIVYTASSGTLNHVSSVGVGFGADINVVVNDGSSQTVAVKDSSLGGNPFDGILAVVGPGTLAVTVEGNSIVGATNGVTLAP